jgi:hypothetical protein
MARRMSLLAAPLAFSIAFGDADFFAATRIAGVVERNVIASEVSESTGAIGRMGQAVSRTGRTWLRRTIAGAIHAHGHQHGAISGYLVPFHSARNKSAARNAGRSQSVLHRVATRAKASLSELEHR